MERTTKEFILEWIKNSRNAIGFQSEDDPALMLLIVKKFISNLPGQRMPRRQAQDIYQSLRLAADGYSAAHPELRIFGGYDTPLKTIKTILEETWRR